MDSGSGFRASVGQLPGDGGEGQQVVVLGGGFVLLERLAAAAHHIEFAAIFQHILLGIRLMLVPHQPGGEGAVGGFHGGIPMIHPDGDGLAHLASPRFFLILLLFFSVARTILISGLVRFQVSSRCLILCANSSGVKYLAHSFGR